MIKDLSKNIFIYIDLFFFWKLVDICINDNFNAGLAWESIIKLNYKMIIIIIIFLLRYAHIRMYVKKNKFRGLI